MEFREALNHIIAIMDMYMDSVEPQYRRAFMKLYREVKRLLAIVVD